jgi:hypothetical protein
MPKALGISLITMASLSVLTGCGPSKAWNGKWILNKTQSTTAAPSFVISITSTGMYRLDAGNLAYSFACDGNKHPTTAHRFISCTQKSSTVIDSTSTVNGVVVERNYWELSPDESSLSITATTSPASGGVATSKKNVFSRVDKSMGFIGAWKNTKPFENVDFSLELTLKDHTLHLAHPGLGQYADISLDGTEAVIHGKSAPAGDTIALKPNGSHEFIMHQKVQGREVDQGTMELSGDGQTLIEEYWTPGDNRKSKLVFERQP